LKVEENAAKDFQAVLTDISPKSFYTDVMERADCLGFCQWWVTIMKIEGHPPPSEVRLMCHSTLQNHILLNIIIFCPKIASDTTWKAILLYSFEEHLEHSIRPLVRCTEQIDNLSGVPINSSMDIETPWTTLLIPVLMPESISSSHMIHTTADGSGPAMSKW
jgi:hypothetical protein